MPYVDPIEQQMRRDALQEKEDAGSFGSKFSAGLESGFHTGWEQQQKRQLAMDELRLKADLENQQYEKRYPLEIEKLKEVQAAGIDKLLAQQGFQSKEKALDRAAAQNRAETMAAGKAAATAEKPSKGQEQVDKEFAKQYSEFVVGGGFADVQKGLNNLKLATDKLETSKNLTGPLVGMLPGSIRPESKAVQDMVQEVAQRNLRLVLGPQFTEKEGAQVMARAYDPTLPEKENLRRVKNLTAQIETAAKAKQAAANYFNTHGTLKGYQGKTTFSISDFDPEKEMSVSAPSATQSPEDREARLQYLRAKKAGTLGAGK